MNLNKPEVWILILNWNQKETTLTCLKSLRELSYPNYKILLVDNASSDGSSEMIRNDFPEAKIVVSKKNLGCAGGRNLGIDYFLKETEGDYLFFLDNDVVEIATDSLDELVKVAEADPKIGVVGMKVYCQNYPNKFCFVGGGKINWLKGNFYNSGQGEIDEGQFDRRRDIDCVTGGFSFIKRKVLERVGKLDERYFIYYEDTDWCIRVKKAGFKISFAPKAKVWHKVASSLGMGSPTFYYYRTRNRLLFMFKNTSKIKFFLFIVYFIYDFCKNTLYPLALGKKPEELKAAFQGILDFFMGNFGGKGIKTTNAG